MSTGRSGSNAGRFRPLAAAPKQTIERPRLSALLVERFEHRLTLLVAPAGAGKTTALSAAVEQQRLAGPLGAGDDAWLSVVDADRAPEHLLDGLGAALGVTGADLGGVCDAIWSRAPRRVALVVDDAHLLAGSASIGVLGELLAALPTNGSLVLASRVELGLAVARLRAHGHVLQIGPDELAFRDDELVALCETRNGSDLDPTTLPRHAASADLQLIAGADAGSAFVWEEILAGLDHDRLHHLQRLAVLDHLDDVLIERVTDGAAEPTALFDQLPLVEYGEGTYRMHDILRSALTERLAPGEASKALAIAADAERERHRLADAVALHDAAGDPISAVDCARQLALGPILSMSSHESAAVRRTVRRLRPDSHLNAVFDALSYYAGAEEGAAAALDGAAAQAQAAGDHDVEVVCRHRAAQVLLLQHQPGYRVQVDRIGELAAVSDLAAALGRYYASIDAQLAGDGTAAVDVLGDLAALDAMGPMHALQVRAERLSDLGRPEDVIVGIDRIDHDAMPQAVGQWVGMALLQCAVGSPEQAMSATLRTAAAAERRGFSHPASFTTSVASALALACGDLTTAERMARRARTHADTGVGPTAEAVVRLAEAALLVDAGEPEAAHRHVESITDSSPSWPSRAELWALPLAYVLLPDRRQVLDAASLGPSLAIARAAGRAVVSLHQGEVTQAAALPWDRLDLLRTHVTPLHLVELACVAADDRPEAAEALTSIPRADSLLGRIAGGTSAAASHAARLASAVPATEPFSIRVQVLGPARVSRFAADEATRSDGRPEIAHTELARRPKAAELLGFLVERGRVDRLAAIGELWPDHDDERKALASLRTTLGILNDALDPNREPGSSAFHLRIDGDLLALDERAVTDVAEFENAVRGARDDDEQGLPEQALLGYQRALEHYRGDFLHGLDVGWAEFTRVRLRSLATGAMCRVSELLAARGRPEEAGRWAGRALGHDDLDERAVRCLATALDAAGDRAAARRCLDAAFERLAAADLTPATETIRLQARFR